MSQATHAGGCHCAAVRFDVDIDLAAGGSRCNCTWCVKRGAIGAIVKPHALRLRAGEDALGVYEWGARVARYYFCMRCGVQLFSRGNLPELGGEFAGVNLNCLDDVDPAALKIVYWDGRHDNWHAGPRAEPWPVATAGAAAGADARI